MSEEGIVFNKQWFRIDDPPITPADTGEIAVPVIREESPDNFYLDVCIYRSNNTWFDPQEYEPANNIVAWIDITLGEALPLLGLSYIERMRRKAEKLIGG